MGKTILLCFNEQQLDFLNWVEEIYSLFKLNFTSFIKLKYPLRARKEVSSFVIAFVMHIAEDFATISIAKGLRRSVSEQFYRWVYLIILNKIRTRQLFRNLAIFIPLKE
jgi:hypothetical protein